MCIVDDASTEPAVRECLEREAEGEPRVRVRHREVNGGIAQATNDALAMAEGEYCALLDHDDTLAPDALLCMAEAIAESPHATLFFSDEDKLDAAGQRTMPFFKPAWDGEWIRTTNCVLHLMVVRTDTLRALGGFALGIDGAQDWDLVLRVAESAGRERIRHLPYVLYHWRELPGSTAAAAFEKPALVTAQRQVIVESLRRRGEAGAPTLGDGGLAYRVRGAGPAASRVDRHSDAGSGRSSCARASIRSGAALSIAPMRSC